MTAARTRNLKAHAAWLVCQEECIPGKADLTVTFDFKTGHSHDPAATPPSSTPSRARLPVPNTRWNVHRRLRHGRRASGTPTVLDLTLHDKTPRRRAAPPDVRFFPEQPNVLANDAKNQGAATGNEQSGYHLAIQLAQNGEKPDHLSGVLVSDQPLQGDAEGASASRELPGHASRASAPAAGRDHARNHATRSAPAPPGSSAHRRARAAPTPTLIAVLGFAFLGGLILNLMPCVLPVLSLKVFSLIRHAGENSGGAWKQGVAFTAGVVISFWILAGLLIALESAGSHLGWGFQMQSPGFVLALIFLFFLLGLNLFGVFELGTSLVGRRREGHLAPRRPPLLVRQRRAGRPRRHALHRAVHGLRGRLCRAATRRHLAAGLHRSRARHGRALSRC